VKRVATLEPYTRSMKVDTMKSDSGARPRHELAPRHHAENRQVDPDVDQRDHRDADQDDRGITARLRHFVADVGDAVVAEVVVDPDARRGAEAEQEPTENEKAPGGASKASAGSKWRAPVTMTAAVVSSVPAHRLTVRRPIDPIFRYSRAMFSTPTAIATITVPPCVRPGRHSAGYPPKPMYPDAISSGPLRMNCQMNRNATSAPSLAPNPSRRYRYEPPDRAWRAELAPDQAVGHHDDQATATEQRLRPAQADMRSGS